MAFYHPAFLYYLIPVCPQTTAFIIILCLIALLFSCFDIYPPPKCSLILTFELVLISSWGYSIVSWNRSSRNAGQNTRGRQRRGRSVGDVTAQTWSAYITTVTPVNLTVIAHCRAITAFCSFMLLRFLGWKKKNTNQCLWICSEE